MGFYYYSIFSLLPLGIAYGVLALIYWGIVRATGGMPARKAILSIVAAVFLVLPVGEELWIAWTFGQACKEAGEFIHKKVQVEGFYDDTTHWWRQLAESKFQFVESRDRLHDALWRVERVGDEIKHFKIDRPTARYHYNFEDRGVEVAHKVVKSGAVVIDRERNEPIARYTSFGRRPPWFFVGLDTPAFACDSPGRWPLTKGTLLIYREVLIPAAQQ